MPERIKKGYTDTPEGQIHYRTIGEGRPLIFLHQNPSSSRMWEAVMPGFAALGFRSIAIDTPGYGESDRPDGKPTIEYYAKRMIEFMDLMGIQSAVVVGHHTGALIGGEMAVAYPGRVTHYIPVGYPMLSDEMSERLRATPRLDFTLDGKFMMDVWGTQERLGGKWFTPEIGVRDSIAKLQAGPNWGWAYHAVGAYDTRRLTDRLKTVKTLMITGEGDPMLRFQNAAHEIATEAKAVVVMDGGVNVPDDNPDVFVREVSQFINES